MGHSSLTMSHLHAPNRIDLIRPDAPALADYGAHAVGVCTRHWVHADQVDLVNARAGEPLPVKDRPLTCEIWYPAEPGQTVADAGRYRVLGRDGRTPIDLHGRALRDVRPLARSGGWPLVVVSHGFPGNRFLMSPLVENLASKGFVVVAIDHTDTTYDVEPHFASALRNRPLDVRWIIDQMTGPVQAEDALLRGLVDDRHIGLMGYSMGGYGVLTLLGAGLSARAAQFPGVPSEGLAPLMQGHAVHQSLWDPRIRAAVVFAPGGWNMGLWDAGSFLGIRTPLMIMAGSDDDIVGYAPGVREIFEHTRHAERHLLTFENARHNVAAPMPAPREAWTAVPWLPNVPAQHYTDPVWDNVRMNNIAQHFVSAFMGRHLQGDPGMDRYLQLVEHAREGRWSVNEDGSPKSDHTHWAGFPARTALGLRMEHAAAL